MDRKGKYRMRVGVGKEEQRGIEVSGEEEQR